MFKSFFASTLTLLALSSAAHAYSHAGCRRLLDSRYELLDSVHDLHSIYHRTSALPRESSEGVIEGTANIYHYFDQSQGSGFICVPEIKTYIRVLDMEKENAGDPAACEIVSEVFSDCSDLVKAVIATPRVD